MIKMEGFRGGKPLDGGGSLYTMTEAWWTAWNLSAVTDQLEVHGHARRVRVLWEQIMWDEWEILCSTTAGSLAVQAWACPTSIERLWISASPEQYLDKQGPRTDKVACWTSLIQVQTREFARMWRSGPWSDKAPWPSRKFLTSVEVVGHHEFEVCGSNLAHGKFQYASTVIKPDSNFKFLCYNSCPE